MTDYSVLSDISINALVSRKLYGEPSHEHRLELVNQVVDYCNKPDDAMPIIDDNEIALIPSTDFGWVAISGLMLNGCSSYIDQRLDSCFQHSDINPLRAAMIVFLQMQENNHD